jgi:hypothetical protein
MISETTLMDCENMPAEMAGRFDQPWHFVGEARGNPRALECLCEKCRPKIPLRVSDTVDARERIQTVHLRGHLFITDDMLKVVIYFGVCDKCDSVYWARQGPPFKRARCLAPAVA